MAILNGLAAYALAQALSIDDLRGGWLGTTDNRWRAGTWVVACAVKIAPTLFVHHSIELRPAGVRGLLSLHGFSGHALGGRAAGSPRFQGEMNDHLVNESATRRQPRAALLDPEAGAIDARCGAGAEMPAREAEADLVVIAR